MKILLFMGAFLFCTVAAFGQTHKIDSLKSIVNHTKNKPVKLKAVLALCDEYISLSPDTFYRYALLSRQMAISQNNQPAQKQASYHIANALVQKGLYDTALVVIEKNVKWLREKNEKADINLQNQLTLLKARIFIRSNRYKDALSILFELLQGVENSKDAVLQVKTSSNIGWVKMEMTQHREAIKWLKKAISAAPDTLMPQLGVVYSNIACAYSNIPMADSAAYFIRKSIQISTKTEALGNLANAYFIEAYIYKFKKQYALAEQDYNKAIAIRNKIGDMFFIVSDMAEFADFYAQTNQPLKGIALTKRAIDSATKYKITAKQYLLYSELSEDYKANKDFLNYSKTLERIISLKDSMYQKNSADALTTLQTKYEVKKKEATIAQQRLAIIKQNYFLFGSAILAILSGVIVWLVFKEFRRKQKLRLQEAHEEEKRLSAQAVAFAQEKERKRIAADLHDNLGAQLSFIKRNVNFMIDKPQGFNQTDEKKYLGYVNDTAQNAMVDLRETIWVLNRDEVSIQEFADKLKSYLKQQLLDKKLSDWEFRDHVVENWKLSSGEVMHIFRIVQEVVSNIIKHSCADHIDVKLTSNEPGAYELEIADNGKGFDLSNKYDGHYGLENIHERARNINAQLLMESNIGSGTRVLLIKMQDNTNGLLNNAAVNDNIF